MSLTLRQKKVLVLAKADVAAGRNWSERALSSYVGSHFTWDELLWLGDIERQGMVTRIEAMLIVDKAKGSL